MAKPRWQREDEIEHARKPARGQDPIDPDPEDDDGRQIWWPGYVIVEEEEQQ